MACLVLFVPSHKEIICIENGAGGNLSGEDIKEGVVDYLNYDRHALDYELESVDGGQLDLKEYVEETKEALRAKIPDILDFAYGDSKLDYQLLGA